MEFALILPVMMLILLIAIDFGRVFAAYISNINAAREGAAYAAVHAADTSYTTVSFSAGVTQAARGQSNAQGLSGGGPISVSYTCFSPAAPAPQPSIDCNSASNYAAQAGNQVTVTVTQPYSFITPIIGGFFGGSLALTASATAPVLNPIVVSALTTSLTITASDKTRVVNAATPAFTYVASPSVSLTTPPTCTSTATVSSPVGSYPITCSGAVLAGYSIGYVAGVLTVTAPAGSLTITASDKTRVVNAADPAFTYVASPSVSLTTPPTCTSTATVSSPVGSYPITCSGAVLAGYTISYVAGVLTVTAATCGPITVTITPSSLTQHGNATTLTVSFQGAATPGTVTTWAWQFGDGTVSSAQNPPPKTFTYTLGVDKNGHPTSQQTWTVGLQAITSTGCTGQTTTTVLVGK